MGTQAWSVGIGSIAWAVHSYPLSVMGEDWRRGARAQCMPFELIVPVKIHLEGES